MGGREQVNRKIFPQKCFPVIPSFFLPSSPTPFHFFPSFYLHVPAQSLEEQGFLVHFLYHLSLDCDLNCSLALSYSWITIYLLFCFLFSLVLLLSYFLEPGLLFFSVFPTFIKLFFSFVQFHLWTLPTFLSLALLTLCNVSSEGFTINIYLLEETHPLVTFTFQFTFQIVTCQASCYMWEYAWNFRWAGFEIGVFIKPEFSFLQENRV